jgi:anti-sigma B factor antagonist
MAHRLTIDVRHEDDMVVIVLAGDIDIDTAAQLREVVTQLTDDGAHHLVFDLTAVTFVDSVGLAVFVLARKKLQLRQGHLDIVAPTRRVLAIFKLAGLDQVFRIRRSLAAVLADQDPAEPA